MGWRRSICKVLQDGTKLSLVSPGSSSTSRMSMPKSTEVLPAFRLPSYSTNKHNDGEQILNRSLEARSGRPFYGDFVAFPSHSGKFSGPMHKSFDSSSFTTRTAGIHVGRIAEVPPVEPTYGVGPVGGADRDPQSKGSTPDDFRADYIHMAEPKEIAKEKAAIAQQEPPDYQVKKMMPQWEKPVEEKADSQRHPQDKVFEGKTLKVEGTAEKKGDTTGNESGDRVEGQYGATPSDGKTSRA